MAIVLNCAKNVKINNILTVNHIQPKRFVSNEAVETNNDSYRNDKHSTKSSCHQEFVELKVEDVATLKTYEYTNGIEPPNGP